MSGGHARTTSAMLASPRCGARTRGGGICRAPATQGKRRCRMHGGAERSGAPRGNRNARKHGLFTKKAMAEQKQIQELLSETRRLLRELK
ncbi:HGGxSTG domain-containing protein [Bradyrhizobium sp. UFLA05-112]